MAKKTAVKVAETDADGGSLGNLDDVLSAEQLNPALALLWSELGYAGDAEAIVYISMIDSDGGESRLWKGSPDDYDLEALSKKFGSGSYRVKIYVKSPTGHNVVRGNQVIRIKLLPDDDARLKAARETPHHLLQPQQPALTAESIAAIVRASMPAPVPAPTIDFPAMLKTVAEMARAFMPVQQAQPQQLGISPLDMLKTVVSVVKEIRPARDVNDDDDGPRRGATGNDIWIKMIDKFAPLFESTLRGALPNNGTAPQTAQIDGAPLNNNPLPLAHEETMQQQNDPATAQLKMGLAFLIAQASAGHDPIAYADVVMDNTPEDSLEGLISLPDPVAYCITIDPRIADHREWFTVLFKEIKDAFADDDNTGEEIDAGAAGSVGSHDAP